MADYGIYLSVDDGAQEIRLPVNPPEIEVEIPGQGKTYRIVSLGEINTIQTPSLSEISFESFFPAQRYPFVVGTELLEPASYVEMIDEWRRARKIVRLIVTDGTVDINMLVSIEDFTWREVAGAVGDIEYEMTLKQYRPYGPKLVQIKTITQNNQPVIIASAEKKETRSDTKPQPKVHVLKRGETLWALAQKYLGNGSRWREIADLNGIKDSQVRNLRVGMQIKIPTS
jgi:nucleoid-associated protein YgaU